jgi:hypothetical protein
VFNFDFIKSYVEENKVPLIIGAISALVIKKFLS